MSNPTLVSTLGQTARGEDFEGNRESLLDVILDKVNKSGKAVITSRVIYVAKLSRRENTLDYHKGYLQKLMDRYQNDGDITGLLVLYPFCYVHLLEAKTSVLTNFLRDLSNADQADTRIEKARVISSTEDVPARCAQAWHAAYVQTASNTEHVDPPDSQGAVKVSTEVNTFLRKMGQGLTNLSDLELRKQLNSLHSFYVDLPSPEALLSMASCEDAPTIDEFLEIYDAPVNVDLDSEKVWPMPPPLKYL